MKVSITKSKLDTLANSISSKSGIPILMTLDEMDAAVNGIPTISIEPLLITQNGTYTAPVESAYSPVTVNVKSSLQTKTKTYTPSETAQTETISADAGYNGLGSVAVTVGAISSDYVGTNITRRTSSDLTTSGATVTVPSGYYAEQASESVTTMTLPTSADSAATSGYTSKATINKNTSNQYINIPPGYNNSGGYYTISAVADGSAITPATTITANPSINVSSSGLITATTSATQSVTPVVEEGYISNGTAGNIVVNGSKTTQLTTQAGKTITPTESNQVAVNAGVYTTGAIAVAAIPSDYIGTEIPQRTSTDLVVNGAIVTAPSGYYSTQATKTVASGTAGTPMATKGTVSNHSISITPSVTNTTGYISGGTKTGTAVSVSASELVNGTLSISSSGTHDVTNYASASVASGTEGTPTATKGTVSNHSISITPSVTNAAGYIVGGTKTGTAVTVSASELVSGTKSITENDTGIDVTNYASIDVNVPSEDPTLQEKTNISPTESSQTITADSGYDGLSSVQINAVSSIYVGSGITRRSSSDLTRNTYTVNVPAGYYEEAASKAVERTLHATPTVSVNTSTGVVTAVHTQTQGWVETIGGTTDSTSSSLQLDTQTGTTITPIESEQTAVPANTYTLGAVKVGAISSTYVGSGITQRSSSDLTASGATVTVPAGYYASQTTKSVASGTATVPSSISGTEASTISGSNSLIFTKTISVTPTVTAGYITSGTATDVDVSLTASITPRSGADVTQSGQEISVPAGYYSTGVYKTISSGTAGIPTATKGSVSNHSISVTPSVTNTTGYITGGTKTGTAVSVSASELVSGTYTVDSSGTKDVTNYASASVPSGTAGTPSASKGTVSNHAISVTPSVTNSTGWITGSTKTGTAVTVSASELVSGTLSISSSGTKDVTNYASASVPSGTEGTPTASKGTVSNNSVSVTPSVTNTTGFITGSTKTGTAVTVSASELVNGTKSITENGTGIDVTNYASVDVNVPSEDPDLDELTVTPTESIQIFKPYGDEINYVLPTKNIIYNTNPMVGDIDLSFVTYGRQYKVTGVLYMKSQDKSSLYDILEFDTLWTASEDGEIEFSLTTAGDTVHPTKVTLSKTQIKVYYPEGASLNGYIGLANTTTRYLNFSEKSCDAFSQVTVNAIPSQYIIPTGTKSITENGTGIDVTNYASVDVSVSGGGTPTLQSKTVSYTPTESQQTATVTADSGYDGLSSVGVTVDAISSTYVGSGITRRSSSDLTASGATVTVPAGYYSAQASKAVTTMTLPTSAASSATSGYTSKATIGRSTSNQYINIPPGYNSAGGYYTISAVANGSATAPSSISGTSATVSTGTNTITLTKTVSVTPTVSAGYVSSGTAGSSSVSLTASVTTKGATTYTPSTSNQTIASGTYLTGTQTIAGDSNLVGSNIISGKSIFGVAGTVTFATYYTGTSAPSSSTGSNGDIYLKTVS